MATIKKYNYENGEWVPMSEEELVTVLHDLFEYEPELFEGKEETSINQKEDIDITKVISKEEWLEKVKEERMNKLSSESEKKPIKVKVTKRAETKVEIPIAEKKPIKVKVNKRTTTKTTNTKTITIKFDRKCLECPARIEGLCEGEFSYE